LQYSRVCWSEVFDFNPLRSPNQARICRQIVSEHPPDRTLFNKQCGIWAFHYADWGIFKQNNGKVQWQQNLTAEEHWHTNRASLFILRDSFTSDKSQYKLPFLHLPPTGHIRCYFAKNFFGHLLFVYSFDVQLSGNVTARKDGGRTVNCKSNYTVRNCLGVLMGWSQPNP
jgi:hypothetical protein